MTSPFNQVAKQLVEKNYPIIPIIAFDATYQDEKTGQTIPLKGRGKAPGSKSFQQWHAMRDWNTYNQRLATPFEISCWEQWPDAGVGLLCGQLSGLIAFDFDYDYEEIHDKILDLIPDSPLKKVGRKGFTALYRHNGEKGGKWYANGECCVELLSDGRQTVLPPSIHPDTLEPYKWIGAALHEIDIEKIPYLPENIEEELSKLFDRYKKPEPQGKITPITSSSQVAYGPTTPGQVEEALRYISPDCGYHEWIEIGMALKTEFGDSGFPIWDYWSCHGAKYSENQKTGNNTDVKWNSFHRNEKTIATVFYMAKQNGYIQTIERDLSHIQILEGGDLWEAMNPTAPIIQVSTPEKAESPIIVSKNEEIYLSAPGLLGEIIQWINDTALYDTYALSMAAALPLLGVLKGHKVTDERGLRTNIYTMGMAGSGIGKNHARICVSKLLQGAGMSELMGGNPASTAGLFSAIANGDHRLLIQMDEFGRILKTMNGKNAASHLVGVTTMMMELFSNASGVYQGQEYANHDGKKKRVDIEQPCLCIYATSTPDNVFNSMNSADVVDGFLSRWLLFEDKSRSIDENKALSLDEIPGSILEKMIEWGSLPSNTNPQGNIDALIAIRPKVVKYSSQAESAAKAFRRDMRKKVFENMEKNTGLNAIYARIAEHAAKIALLVFEGGIISMDDYDWASSLALSRGEYLCEAVSRHVSENETERELKKLLKIISEFKQNEGWINKSQLIRKSQWLNSKRRDEILATLIDSVMIDGRTVQLEKTSRVEFKSI